MPEPDEFLDDDAATANRNDTRSAVIITVIALVAVLVASTLVVFGGIGS
ncbi:MAG: hypothetical protein KKH51_06440 [Actinobacteria bacterium]|nr:hypothetical protein [Actinomycetota bacterium]